MDFFRGWSWDRVVSASYECFNFLQVSLSWTGGERYERPCQSYAYCNHNFLIQVARQSQWDVSVPAAFRNASGEKASALSIVLKTFFKSA